MLLPITITIAITIVIVIVIATPTHAQSPTIQNRTTQSKLFWTALFYLHYL